ncbi:plasmid stabilization system protein [Haloferula helveola]|uniref:Plasmid stabilization system protein n=1 Tax=Haloferula helveola TaxID=490095 RepID=A0ABN6H1Q5_9BACT|nr:plasmid stabilization system protein [Haloferula helveola]
MRIRILESAIGDLEAGSDFYNRQEEGVGDYFQDCLFSDIDSLVLYGGIHRQLFGFHRLLSRRFPYAIYYRIEGDVVIVYRVLDCRRDPQRLRRSLGNE